MTLKKEKKITKNFREVKEYPFTFEWLFAIISAELAILAIIFPSILWILAPLSFACLWISIYLVFRGKSKYYYWQTELSYDAESDGIIDDSYFPKL